MAKTIKPTEERVPEIVYRYSKARHMESASPRTRDVLDAVLEDDKTYSVAEANALVAAYLERRV